MAREYDPAVLVHRASCPDAPTQTLQLPLRVVGRDYPNGRLHNCVDQGTQAIHFVIEQLQYPPHDYEPSSLTECPPGEPPVRALCAACRGTHADSHARERIVIQGGDGS